MNNPKARLIAFYLPQYHPIPENDEWWGKGFTEWTNVAKAKPLFPGHHQPNLPSELGFYDLRLPEVREAQALLAREHGIEGFCYWHYWFMGKRLLEKPFNEVLRSGSPDFPFCLAWANVSWSGEWAGQPDRIIVRQEYSMKDAKNHFLFLLPAFLDSRYIKVDGKPIFYIHKPDLIPEVERFIDLWRSMAEKVGLKGLHFIGNNIEAIDAQKKGFDAFSMHYPNHGHLSQNYPNMPSIFKKIGINRFSLYLRKKNNLPAVYSYKKQVIDGYSSYLRPNKNYYPLVIPNWDNTSRLAWRGLVLYGSSPEHFREHLNKVLATVSDREHDERIVFVKSWNEWAEGNYLEPDQRFGRAYLEILRDEVLL